eukprot:TRINITY_DN1522_c0_g1_i6.p1 TRINITY_DN1522_c0_g1~~TRINITY_DN1522_c0_g1_i6.p1  ORF type:complete len:235 (+),score=59.97 TRINITY_DN1522_c0_g1_i6:64-705(+)
MDLSSDSDNSNFAEVDSADEFAPVDSLHSSAEFSDEADEFSSTPMTPMTQEFSDQEYSSDVEDLQDSENEDELPTAFDSESEYVADDTAIAPYGSSSEAENVEDSVSTVTTTTDRRNAATLMKYANKFRGRSGWTQYTPSDPNSKWRMYYQNYLRLKASWLLAKSNAAYYNGYTHNFNSFKAICGGTVTVKCGNPYAMKLCLSSTLQVETLVH